MKETENTPTHTPAEASPDVSDPTKNETDTGATVPASKANAVRQNQLAEPHLALAESSCNKIPQKTDGAKTSSNDQKSGSKGSKSGAQTQHSPVTDEEKAKLETLEANIRLAKEREQEGDNLACNAQCLIADSIYAIQTEKLYRGSHASFEDYARKKFDYSRAHSNRMAKFGSLRARIKTSPQGDTIKLITSEKMARPLLKLSACQQDEALGILAVWRGWIGRSTLTSTLVQAAVIYQFSPQNVSKSGDSKEVSRAQITTALDSLRTCLAADREELGKSAIHELESILGNLLGTGRSSKIQWTQHTWNPLLGCSMASPGCLNCYAAKLVATLMASNYRDLVKVIETQENGQKVRRYQFNGKIALIPERLVEPLQMAEPSTFFVNSMSDLFHPNVEEAFIEQVFRVMEKASWHTFQILTKRPERMSEFTHKYYAGRDPAKNIWLGVSTENQDTFNRRVPELLKTKAAIRWLSVEPMIGPIQMESLVGVDWVVVGGESGSLARRMEKEWVIDVLNACEREKVPFFFKQWGVYGEDGTKTKRSNGSNGKQDKNDPAIALHTAVLDGRVYQNLPRLSVQKPAIELASEKQPGDSRSRAA